MTAALDAIADLPAAGDSLQLNVGVHVGTLLVMSHTLMGRDSIVVGWLCGQARDGAVLVTGEARDAALAEGIAAERFSEPASPTTRFGEVSVWRLR